jgi:probable O-glycosylation ligase (exosortase A-associated)
MNAIARAGQDLAEFLRQRGALLLLVPLAVLVGSLLVMPAPKIAVLAVIAAVPAVLVQVAILRDLFLGIGLYLAVEYLQPGSRLSFIAAVRPAFLVSGALVVAWVLNIMRKRVPLVINWQVKSYGVICILAAISAFNAISVGMVALKLLSLVKTLLVFWIMFSVITNLERLQRLAWLYVVLHVILAVVGLALFATAGERRFGDVGSGFLGDENDSAMALLIMIPYMYFLWPHARNHLGRFALAVGMIAATLTVLYSFSRGAFLGFVAMVVYMWWKSSHKLRSGLLLAAVVLGAFAIMPQEYWDRIESMQGYATEGSAQGRLDAWKGGIRMMLDSPLFGCGIGNFSRTYGEQYNTISARWTAAHSMYIEYIAQLGVPGLIFIVSMIFLTLRTFRKVRRIGRRFRTDEFRLLTAIMRGAECGFIAYLVTTIFLNSMLYPHLWHFGAMAGFGLIVARRLRDEATLPSVADLRLGART